MKVIDHTHVIVLSVSVCLKNTDSKRLIDLLVYCYFLATTQIKAKLCSVEDNTFHVILYVTVEDEKVGYFYICKPVGRLQSIYQNSAFFKAEKHY